MERIRPEFDDWIMEILEVVRKRSTCIRRQHAAITVKDKQLIGVGYNGAPKGCAHCTEESCIRNQLNIPSGERSEICMGAHAEQNAITQCAKHGISTDGATIYVTGMPCIMCMKNIINAGIVTLVVGKYTTGDRTYTELLMKQAGIELRERVE